MNTSSEFAALFKLPIEQRIQLVQDLCDSIADENPELPVPEWQLEELRRRAAKYEAGGAKTYTWAQVRLMLTDEIAGGQ